MGDESSRQRACIINEPPLSHSGSFAEVLGGSGGASEHQEPTPGRPPELRRKEPEVGVQG